MIIEAGLNGLPTDRKSRGGWIYNSFSLSLPCNQDNGSLNMTSFLFFYISSVPNDSYISVILGHSSVFIGGYFPVIHSRFVNLTDFVAVRAANGALEGGGKRLIRSIRMT